MGKFYFRPPGGESCCDVILHLRSVLDTITRECRGEPVLIVGHQVIANCFRYLLERCDEQAILAIDRAADVPNCGITSYAFNPALGRQVQLQLALCNFVAPLYAAGTPVTPQPDMPAAPCARETMSPGSAVGPGADGAASWRHSVMGMARRPVTRSPAAVVIHGARLRQVKGDGHSPHPPPLICKSREPARACLL